jgi:hypothetical protein
MSFDAGDGCWWDDELLGWRVAAGSSDAVLVAVRVENPSRRF